MAAILFNTAYSLETLEGNVWPGIDPPTPLAEKVLRYRKIAVNDLTTEQLRLLIGQNVGLEFLIPIAINQLAENILAEGDFYPGDLLHAVLSADTLFWKEQIPLKKELGNLLLEKENQINDKHLKRSIEAFRTNKP